MGDAEEHDDEVDGDADEDEGSYVPCPVCGEKTTVRFKIDAKIICELLDVAAAVLAMLRAGSRLTIAAAIQVVARAESDHRPVMRCLLPNRFETDENLLLTTETLIEDAFWREALEHERAMQRGPPKQLAGAEA